MGRHIHAYHSNNASNRKAAFAAFRDQSKTGSDEKRLPNKELGVLLDVFIAKHPHLKDAICSDQGIRLMNIDGKITARIINTLTAAAGELQGTQMKRHTCSREQC